MAYRTPTDDEISLLRAQGCTATDWGAVELADPRSIPRLRDVRFSGRVRIGRLTGTVDAGDDVPRPCGVYRSTLHDCDIRDEAYVADVGVLARYVVAAGALIERLGSLTTTGETSFGNGFESAVVNEQGGRSIPVCDQMTSQIAYLGAMYRHDPVLVAAIRDMVEERARQLHSTRGEIGTGARLADCASVRNVRVGPYALVEGTTKLEEGTIVSSKEAPARIGHGVNAVRFIVCEDAVVDGGASLVSCFVGQGARVGCGFTASDSYFSANSELFQGEAANILAGPFTASHHKSTLLIAGLFSFFNAGSGTNQSNHKYKLGALHQGIAARGVKTGSSSYLMWPTQIGAFSMVIGKHQVAFDGTALPFSLVLEQDGRNVAWPGMALAGCGLWRDGMKWETRERRRSPRKSDIVDPDILSPYTLNAVLQGMNVLSTLSRKPRLHGGYVMHKGLAVRHNLLDAYRRYYESALNFYVGHVLCDRLYETRCERPEDINECLGTCGAAGRGEWVDVGGMLVPVSELHTVLDKVRGGTIATLDAFLEGLTSLHSRKHQYIWDWCGEVLEERYGIEPSTAKPHDMVRVLEICLTATADLRGTVEFDASKEFDQPAMVGYGIDGDEEIRREDFEAVRGTPESNAALRKLQERFSAMETKLNAILERLRAL